MLSDGAKRLLYRDRELDLVRMMLEQDIAAGDHDAALRLVDELGAQFGRLEEAEHHRTRIESLRRAEVDRRIAEGMQAIRRLLATNDWNGATQAADRLHRLLPDAPGLEDLGNQIAGPDPSLHRGGDPDAGRPRRRTDRRGHVAARARSASGQRRVRGWSTSPSDHRRPSRSDGATLPSHGVGEGVVRRGPAGRGHHPGLPQHPDGGGGRGDDADPATRSRRLAGAPSPLPRAERAEPSRPWPGTRPRMLPCPQTPPSHRSIVRATPAAACAGSTPDATPPAATSTTSSPD